MFGRIGDRILRRRTIRRGEDRLDVVLERALGVGQFQAADVTGMRDRLASKRLGRML